jgi:hypothetical protein
MDIADAGALYVGATVVEAAYKGAQLVWTADPGLLLLHQAVGSWYDARFT